jgi:ribosomal protein S18 acetylase RimI-like enzyme
MEKESPHFQIREIMNTDRSWLPEFLINQWGDDFVIVHGTSYYPAELPGFLAETDQREIIGLLTYQIKDRECEIVTLDSLKSGIGIGSSLIEKVFQKARENNCTRLWLITTNDNLNALGFYQKRGFVLARLYPEEVTRSRLIKPGIPLLGENNIPIRDEIELELNLSY